MSLSADTVWEVRTAGNDTNGGGFVTGASGTDYSQQDNANVAGSDISTTDGVGNGTTTFTSATANFGTTIVGNIIYLQGGTGGLAAGRYQVTARASSTSVTLDRSVAAGTGITMNIGGAVASLGILGSTTATIPVAGNIIWIKAGTYTITSATPNIANGCFSAAITIHIEGYQTTRGDLGTKPLLQASGISTFTMIANSVNGYHKIANLHLDGAGLTLSRGIDTRNQILNCRFQNFTNSAAFSQLGNDITIYNCYATGCSVQPAFSGFHCVNCVAGNNTCVGFIGIANTYVRCISHDNAGALIDGFQTVVTSKVGNFINCIAYNNGRDGFRIISDRGGILLNCIAENNGGVGFNIVNVPVVQLSNCAGFNNTGGNVSLGTGKGVVNYAFVTGTGTFFTDAPNEDFSLNNVSGGGFGLRGTGLQGTFVNTTTVGYLDIGAAQHAGSYSNPNEHVGAFFL